MIGNLHLELLRLIYIFKIIFFSSGVPTIEQLSERINQLMESVEVTLEDML
jgi:hypothetical protein